MKDEDFLNHLQSIKRFLSDELTKIRAGRANPALFEDLKISAYEGAEPLPLKELASISVPEPQSVLITPWDKTILKKIEDAIRNFNLGFNPVNEGDDLRIPVPSLTEERRKEIVKNISEIVEQAKIRVRTLRQDVIRSVEEQQDNGVISEDDMFRKKKEIENKVKEINEALEQMGEDKKAEVLKV